MGPKGTQGRNRPLLSPAPAENPTAQAGKRHRNKASYRWIWSLLIPCEVMARMPGGVLLPGPLKAIRQWRQGGFPSWPSSASWLSLNLKAVTCTCACECVCACVWWCVHLQTKGKPVYSFQTLNY